VYTQTRVSQLLDGPLGGINFVTSSGCETGLLPTHITYFPKDWHKRAHYSKNPPTNLEYVDPNGVLHHNASIEIYFGSQWMTLTKEVCGFLIKELHRPDSLPSVFRDWLINTKKLMADETFFSTMVVKYFSHTLPELTDDYYLNSTEVKMDAIRYERMDEHVPSSRGWFPTEQRYDVPVSMGVEQPRPWGPYFLGYVLYV
jgi:hypothetical protein